MVWFWERQEFIDVVNLSSSADSNGTCVVQKHSSECGLFSSGENEAWCAKPVLGMLVIYCWRQRSMEDCWAVGLRTKLFGTSSLGMLLASVLVRTKHGVQNQFSECLVVLW